jgi:tetratricopeptide (TPR) repeat protein
LLKKGGEEIAKYEPSIRLRMAGIFRERGKYDEAQEQIDWILSDAKRQNSLDTQVQAAELLQIAGAQSAAADPNKADGLLREAIVGRKAGTSVVWGWGGIANKLSKQVGGGGKADELFYEARMNLAKCMLERAQLPGKPADKKTELLTSAKKAIAVTRKLYPSLGGESTEKRFDKLLKEIQKAQGLPPRGFEELDEQDAAAKPVAAAAGT